MRELVLVHGRSQEHKDAVALKEEWLDALREGMQKSGLQIPISEDRIRFPYYGQTLFDLVDDVDADEVAEVIVRGGAVDNQEQEFVLGVLDDVRAQKGVTDEHVMLEAQATAALRGGGVVERGVLNWPWVRAILSAIDRHVPGASGASIALATLDVHRYLSNPGVRDVIDAGVRQALSAAVESVVVGHSLGSVVAYSLLRRDGKALGWRVPLYVTVGSPLAVTKIRRALAPNRHPECADKWFNAMDPDDVVALYPLDSGHFPVVPEIENKTDIDNTTANQHGIAGYLSDPVVARRIHDALVGD